MASVPLTRIGYRTHAPKRSIDADEAVVEHQAAKRQKKVDEPLEQRTEEPTTNAAGPLTRTSLLTQPREATVSLIDRLAFGGMDEAAHVFGDQQLAFEFQAEMLEATLRNAGMGPIAAARQAWQRLDGRRSELRCVQTVIPLIVVG